MGGVAAGVSTPRDKVMLQRGKRTFSNTRSISREAEGGDLVFIEAKVVPELVE
jgi:hypothetical protein